MRVLWAGAILGFAFGGFFDGILLHQVLQWHHFLSLVPRERFQSTEVQILADGLFHVAVYLIALAGLIMLWRKGSYRPTDRPLLGWAVLGFSIWQFADVVLVHWVLGIHRVRVGVPNPLLWDVGWLVVFGVTSMFFGHLASLHDREPARKQRESGRSGHLRLHRDWRRHQFCAEREFIYHCPVPE